MSLKYPDILEHNNPNNPLMDVNQLEGVSIIDLLTERDTIPLAKRKEGHFTVSKDTGKSYIYTGTTLDDIDWNNTINWTEGGGGAGLSTLPASQVTVVTPSGFTATEQQTFDEQVASRVVTLETSETPPTIGDTDNVRFKSITGYFIRPLLDIYNYFVAKSVPPQELSDLLDTDVMFGARGTDARYWSFVLVIQRLLSYLPKDSAYTATSWADVQAICESPTCPTSIAIHLVSDVQIGNLTTYAKNIIFSGRQVTVSASVSIISGAAGAGTYRMTFESGLACYTAEPSIIFGSSANIQDWDVRVRDLKGSKTTLSIVKASPSTCTFRYNKTTNLIFAATNVVPSQANMWFELTQDEITTVVNVGDTPDTRYYIGDLPYGWMVESISAQAQLNSASFAYAFESSTEGVYTQWSGTVALSGSIIFSLHGNFATVSTQPVFNNGLLEQLNPVYVNSKPSTVKSIAVVPVAMANTITVFKLKIVKVL